MLEYNEIKEKRIIVLDNEPYEVIHSHVLRKQQRKPVNQTKLKHLISGGVTEKSFGSSDKVEEADIERKNIKFLFVKPSTGNKSTEYWFSAENDPKDRFTLDEEIVVSSLKYLRPNDIIESLIFNDKYVGIKIPIKVDLKVTEAEPAVKGNTATGATKQVTLETGYTLNVPLFINEGDILRINTSTGEYTERTAK